MMKQFRTGCCWCLMVTVLGLLRHLNAARHPSKPFKEEAKNNIKSAFSPSGFSVTIPIQRCVSPLMTPSLVFPCVRDLNAVVPSPVPVSHL